MNTKHFITLIFIFTTLQCNIRVVQHFASILKSSLKEYHIIEHNISG